MAHRALVFSLALLAAHGWAAGRFPGIKALERVIPSKVKGFERQGPPKAEPGATETQATFRAKEDDAHVEVSVKWDDGSTDELDALTNHEGCADEKLGARTVRVCPAPQGLYRFTIDWKMSGLDVLVGVDVKSHVTDERARELAFSVAQRVGR